MKSRDWFLILSVVVAIGGCGFDAPEAPVSARESALVSTLSCSPTIPSDEDLLAALNDDAFIVREGATRALLECICTLPGSATGERNDVGDLNTIIASLRPDPVTPETADLDARLNMILARMITYAPPSASVDAGGDVLATYAATNVSHCTLWANADPLDVFGEVTSPLELYPRARNFCGDGSIREVWVFDPCTNPNAQGSGSGSGEDFGLPWGGPPVGGYQFSIICENHLGEVVVDDATACEGQGSGSGSGS